MHDEGCCADTDQTTNRCKDEALRKQLADDSSLSRLQRHTHRELAATRSTAREQYARQDW